MRWKCGLVLLFVWIALGCQDLCGQKLHGANWVFGNFFGLKFRDGIVSRYDSSGLPASVQPSSILTSSGEIHHYTNGIDYFDKYNRHVNPFQSNPANLRADSFSNKRFNMGITLPPKNGESSFFDFFVIYGPNRNFRFIINKIAEGYPLSADRIYTKENSLDYPFSPFILLSNDNPQIFLPNTSYFLVLSRQGNSIQYLDSLLPPKISLNSKIRAQTQIITHARNRLMCISGDSMTSRYRENALFKVFDDISSTLYPYQLLSRFPGTFNEKPIRYLCFSPSGDYLYGYSARKDRKSVV